MTKPKAGDRVVGTSKGDFKKHKGVRGIVLYVCKGSDKKVGYAIKWDKDVGGHDFGVSMQSSILNGIKKGYGEWCYPAHFKVIKHTKSSK